MEKNQDFRGGLHQKVLDGADWEGDPVTERKPWELSRT